jgi:hypothetical protein
MKPIASFIVLLLVWFLGVAILGVAARVVYEVAALGWGLLG